jgi:hypothetical protein
MTVKELRTLAKSAELSGYSGLTKAQLIKLLRKAGAGSNKKAVKTRPAGKTRKSSRKAAPSRDKAPDKFFQFGDHAEPAETASAYDFPRVDQLPDRYQSETLSLLVRDEKAMFVLWELSPELIERARHGFGSEEEWHRRRMVFRLFRVGSGPREPVGQFDVFGETGRYHMFTPQPDCDYYCILGFLRDDDQFVELMRSNTVHAPRISPVTSGPRWATAQRAGEAFVLHDLHAPEGWPAEAMEPRSAPGKGVTSPGTSFNNLWVRPAGESSHD